MDMDFKGSKKPSAKLNVKMDSGQEPKALPTYRASSELPEHGTPDKLDANLTDKELAEAFGEPTQHPGEPDFDPTDLTLDRDKIDNDVANALDDTKSKKNKMSKKHLFILLGLLFIVILGAGGYLYYDKVMNKPLKSNAATNTAKVIPKEVSPTTAPAPITGLEVSLEASKKPVTAVMIENSVSARPQSGLRSADMVVEAVAEGGITRFVALFQQGNPTSIGPIRSARPYYVQIARTFDAAYVHAGGSDDGLQQIIDLGVKDMSAFEDNGTYIRVDDRDAPHNLYSTMASLDSRRTQLGYTTSAFTPWLHKNDTPQTPTASSIHFSLSSADFNADFIYDSGTNTYKRSEGGDPQLDAQPDPGVDSQLAPKVVIGLITSKGQDSIYSTYRLTGTGDFQVFQDGIMSNGTWSKDLATSQFVFKDKNGLPFAFNKGQVWMTLLGSPGDISTQP